MVTKPVLTLALLASLTACGGGAMPTTEASGDATSHTLEANRAVARALPLEEMRSFEDARRGFIATDRPLKVTGPDGETVWDFDAYAFIEGDAPGTVNPSLWRQAKLNGYHGLFEVVPGIHQVRGYDISNMTLIEGRSGWIVVDPLTTRETAAAAIALARRHLGDRPVSAVIFTHSHADHFGGGNKVLALKDLAQKAIEGVVPQVQELRWLDNQTLIERLSAVRGIGRWTVEMMLMFRLGRPDVLPVDDLGVRKGAQVVLGLADMPTPKQLAEIGIRWAPWRTLASMYLWRVADFGSASRATVKRSQDR